MIGQDALYSLTGKTVRFFRAGIADYDETAVVIVRESGLMPGSFTINGDGGAACPSGTVFREVTAAKAGEIIIAHLDHPRRGTAPGMARAIPALQSFGRGPVGITHVTAGGW
jgi:peptidoglycan/xylan/chitin deacetylase (PgdA/CDA1 family)